MSDIHNLEKLVDGANIAIVIALALSLIGGGANIFFNRKLNKIKDLKHDNEMQAASTKIEETKLENSKLRLDLETATAESQKKQTDLVVEQQKLTEAQKQLAKAEMKRAEAQLELEKTLEEVRKKMPRTLTPEQRTYSMDVLKSLPKGEVEFWALMGDGEGNAFAMELIGLLKASGWKVTGDGVNFAMYSDGNPKGVSIIRKEYWSKATMPALALLQAFENAGFAFLYDPKLDEGKIIIRVGNRP